MTEKQHRRRRKFVNALCDMEVDEWLTPEQKAAVIELVKEYELTRADFRYLDETPGDWGYDIMRDGVKKTWHWKLRQTRNDPSVPLFKALRR